MKRVSPRLELRALATILDGRGSIRNQMLSATRREHFGHRPAAEIYDRIHGYIQANRDIPSARIIAEDPALSTPARLFIKSGLSPKQARHPSRLSRLSDIAHTVERLDTYRQQRIFYMLAKDSAEEISRDNPNHAGLASKIESYLMSVRSSTGSMIFHVGASNEGGLFQSVLDDNESMELIPTGFESFDTNTGGFGRTNLVFFASNYGGGKSVFGMQVGINMYLAGYNVLWVSLEMDEGEAWDRIHSNISGVEHDAIRRRKLTPYQKDELQRARKRFIAHGVKHKCRFSTYHPGYIDPWQLLAEIRGYAYDVVIIDYIGLLMPPHGTSNEERIQLGETAKILKIIAGKRYLNCAMLVMAQLNDDNRLKYSRAMAEHANNLIWWRLDDASRERGNVIAHQDKARNSRLYDIQLLLDFQHMRIQDGGVMEKDSIRKDMMSTKRRSSAHTREMHTLKEKTGNSNKVLREGNGKPQGNNVKMLRSKVNSGKGVMPELTSL